MLGMLDEHELASWSNDLMQSAFGAPGDELPRAIAAADNSLFGVNPAAPAPAPSGLRRSNTFSGALAPFQVTPLAPPRPARKRGSDDEPRGALMEEDKELSGSVGDGARPAPALRRTASAPSAAHAAPAEAAPGGGAMSAASVWRGVSRLLWSTKFESHAVDRAGKAMFCGSFDSEERAARAYDVATCVPTIASATKPDAPAASSCWEEAGRRRSQADSTLRPPSTPGWRRWRTCQTRRSSRCWWSPAASRLSGGTPSTGASTRGRAQAGSSCSRAAWSK